MPTYEYACSSCGNTWEELQKITEPPVEVCPACKKATAKRQISGGNFILKGGGWYADLYSSSKSSSAKSDSSSAKGDASTASSESKSDAGKKDGGGKGGSGSTGTSSSGSGSSGGGSSSSAAAAE